MKQSPKRQHLIEVAARLFNRLGYHAAGIDHVIAEAGIAKTTLYRHFQSKEDLIVAVLKQIDAEFREAMRSYVETAAQDPAGRLLATFDYLERWFRDAAFYGCPFVSAAAEYAERPSPVFQEAAMHKRLMTAYFEELARAAGLADPVRIAEEVRLLHEGAIAIAHVNGDPAAAVRAKAIAERIVLA